MTENDYNSVLPDREINHCLPETSNYVNLISYNSNQDNTTLGIENFDTVALIENLQNETREECSSNENNLIQKNFHQEELQNALCQLIQEASSTYSLGNIKKSLRIYDQLIRIDSANNVLFANRSAIFLKLGCTTEAILDAEHSIRLKPNWPKVFYRFSNGEELLNNLINMFNVRLISEKLRH